MVETIAGGTDDFVGGPRMIHVAIGMIAQMTSVTPITM